VILGHPQQDVAGLDEDGECTSAVILGHPQRFMSTAADVHYAELVKVRARAGDGRPLFSITYIEIWLGEIAGVPKRIQAGLVEEKPEKLDTTGKRALWNNLGQNEELALKIDAGVREVRPDGWRGVQAREQVIKEAIYKAVQDSAEVERLFLIVKAQGEY
jgi:type I restriction enzyme R subunit